MDDIRAAAAKRPVVPLPKSDFKITRMLTNSSTPGAAPEIRNVAQIGGSLQVLWLCLLDHDTCLDNWFEKLYPLLPQPVDCFTGFLNMLLPTNSMCKWFIPQFI